MRLTLDSNVLVRAVVSPQGPALRLLNLVLTDHILVLSRFILDEVERVLLYPRIQTRYRTTPEEAARFSQHLGDASMLVDPEVERSIIQADPSDDVVLFTAARGKADILCTQNLRHFGSPEARAFCDERRIRVMTDVEALSEFLQ